MEGEGQGNGSSSLLNGGTGQGTPVGAGAPAGGQAGTGTPATPPAGEAAGAGTGAAATPPEITYTPFQSGIEGFTLDEATTNELTAIGKELKLNQAQVEKLVNLGARKFTDGQEALRLEVQRKIDDWGRQADNDPSITSDGLGRAKSFMARAVGDEGMPKFTAMLKETGIHQHPEFIKFCINASRLVGEAPMVSSGGSGDANMSLLSQAHALYGNM